MKSLPLLFLSLIFWGTACTSKKADDPAHWIEPLKGSTPYCEDSSENKINNNDLLITREWKDKVCRSSITNTGSKAIAVNNIVLFELNNPGLPDSTSIYGEGFQLLTQLAGTLGKPVNIGGYTDENHYKIIGPHKMRTAYGLFHLTLPDKQYLMLAFSTCQKFIGRISFSPQKIMVSIDGENLVLQPGQKVELEDFMLLTGNDLNVLYDELTRQIAKTHPPGFGKEVPVGWCSWYCYGPDVTQKDIRENLKGFAEKLPGVKYIQIDDGFQPFMGDWLEANPKYGSLANTLSEIKKAGFIPAIWLAPFIAEKNSKLFREHPGWFVKDRSGQPLNSATVGFGGWRNGPWYALDGTHPEAQAYLKNVVKTMREKWGVEYFKLDANYWGAIHKGVHYRPTATRIEAYREGMKAIVEACDKSTVILGCNQPIWPSLGLVSANRTSNDVSRNWNSIRSTAKENLMRTWQNGKLWYADPDCLLLAPNGEDGKQLSQNEFMFHATVVHAVGGLMLLGDKFASLTGKQFDIIKKQLHPTGQGARFDNPDFQTGVTDLGNEQFYYFLNWEDKKPVSLKVKLKGKSSLENYWEGTDLGVHEGDYELKDLPPHSGVVIRGKLQ